MTEIVLSFLRFLFLHQGLDPVTITHYKLALAKPLETAFGVSFTDRVFSEFSKALFLIKLSNPTRPLSWSLEWNGMEYVTWAKGPVLGPVRSFSADPEEKIEIKQNEKKESNKIS